MFNPDEAKYANGVLVELPYPTDDSRLLTKAAQEGVERVFREGFRYSTAEVLLLDLSQPIEITGDLSATAQPVASEKLMGVLDAVNGMVGGVGDDAVGECAGRSLMGYAAGDDEPELHVDELWTVYRK
ncbi:hypothetical protein AA098_03380 [Pseudomonas sp. JY-Q]|nr:hypothetical protein AA098_03380 [Pseudomonas sp. JY-Q]